MVRTMIAACMIGALLTGVGALAVPAPAFADNIPDPGPPACGYCGVVGCHNECQNTKAALVDGPPVASAAETRPQPRMLYQVVGLAFREGRATVNVRYPQFNKPWLDEQLKAVAMAHVDSFLQQAREFAADDDRTRQYALDIDFSVRLLNGQLLSMLYTVYENYAGAHPSTTTVSVNADLAAGRLLTFADLFRPGTAYLPVIARVSIDRLRQQLENCDEDWLQRGAGPALENYNVFYLTPYALAVHFNHYQVACYAAGPQEITFAINEEPVSGLIRPDLPGKLAAESY